MDALFWTAFALGLAFCAPPGAVMAEALRRGIHRGFGGALLTELGSLVGDATWAALALSGVAYLAVYRPVSAGLAALGVLLLFYLAARAFRDAWVSAGPVTDAPASGSDLAAGAALSLSNPQNIAFWLGMGGGAVAALGATRQQLLTVFFAAFMLACLAWCFFMAVMIAWGRRFLTGRWYRWINVACGTAMAYFGVKLLASLIGTPPAVRAF
ncbi:MAG TPA: LysE family transporter [bacterium]|nr:LysE family transporter [bacterium]